MQVLRDVVALQGGPDELAWVVLGPGRQDDVVQGHAALLAAQVEPVGVDQKVGQVKELGDQLLDVGHVELGGRPPGLTDRVEQPVGQIKVSALQLEELLGDGLQPDQVGADDHGRRVVGAVVVGARLVVSDRCRSGRPACRGASDTGSWTARPSPSAGSPTSRPSGRPSWSTGGQPTAPRWPPASGRPPTGWPSPRGP
jgi:hypothetical protein